MGVFVSPHSFCNLFNYLSGSRVRARIGLNSVHSVILLLIRERAVRFFCGAMSLPFTIMGGGKSSRKAAREWARGIRTAEMGERISYSRGNRSERTFALWVEK